MISLLPPEIYREPYMIIRTHFPEDLHREINEALKAGYKLAGGMYTYTVSEEEVREWAQAIYKDIENFEKNNG